jgi:hypothetical protein
VPGLLRPRRHRELYGRRATVRVLSGSVDRVLETMAGMPEPFPNLRPPEPSTALVEPPGDGWFADGDVKLDAQTRFCQPLVELGQHAGSSCRIRGTVGLDGMAYQRTRRAACAHLNPVASWCRSTDLKRRP